MNLLGLLSGDLKRRYGSLGAFAKHAFLHVLRPHCRRKIEKRLHDIDAGTFKKFLMHLDHVTNAAFIVHKKGKKVDGVKKKLGSAGRLEAIKKMLTTVTRYCEAGNIDDDKEANYAMLYSYILFNSRNFRS